MAKLINWNNFNKGFGETFNYTLNNERRLQQQQAQFDQEMEYRNRQSDLDQDYRNSTLDISRENLDINKRQEDRLETGQKIDIMKGLLPSQEGGVGAMTGGDWEKQTGVDLYPAEKEKDFYSMFQEAVPKSYNETTLDPFKVGNKSGFLEQKWEVDPNDPTNRRRIDTGSFYSDKPGTTSTNTNENDFKEGKLSEAGAKALGLFTEPDLSSGFLGIFGGTSESEAKKMIADNMATFAKDIVGSDTYKYIKNFFDEAGYVDPETLRLNAINDMNMGNLTEKQANEMATFLNYHDTMYDGIKKIEGKIK